MSTQTLARSSFNPYRHLLSKITALLRLEAKMTAEERRANQWQLLVKFNGTQVTVGKGDVNTIFCQFGENGERKVCYPDQILERLSTLGAQKYWRFEVVTADGKSKWFWSLDAIKKKVTPARGMKVYGHTDKRTLLHTTKQGLDAYEWK
jgi:hypothetical protein